MSHLKLYYKALSDNGEVTGCPADCECREDAASILEYTKGQRDSVFPWETAESVYVKLASPTVVMRKVGIV